MQTKPKVGINGFGRMGFCALRCCVERGIPVKAINASRTPMEIAYKFEFDTTHGHFYGKVQYDSDKNTVTINGNEIQIVNERSPRLIPWGDLGVDYVIDATGKFLTRELAFEHIEYGGARKVILSSPVREESQIPMFVYGVNNSLYNKGMHVVSNASCTTNCLAPLVKVVNDNFEIKNGIMTTIHAVTSKQHVVDGHDAKDPRIGRSTDNIIPSSTGAAKAIGRIIPELNGKLTGMSVRVPVRDVSLIDLTVNLEEPVAYSQICEAIKEASENEMKGIIRYWDEYVVSSDFVGSKVTCNFDAKAGVAISSTFVKLFAWYDNEMSYMNQLINMLEYMYMIDNG
jgi:glyceraldehyde 3-phosphate dehydrogenase